MAERVAFGLLLVTEQQFWHVSLLRLNRAYEWCQHQDEWQQAHTRLLAYYMGNHKASTPEDMWQLPSEAERWKEDLLEGRIKIAQFKKLTPEEIENFTK